MIKCNSAVGNEFCIEGGFSIFKSEVHDLGKIAA